jgi:hypothetical protein
MSLWTGVKQLIESPSGVFSLIALFVIALVSWKQPTVGGVALAAFAGAVPAILAFCEHKETLAQMAQSVAPPQSSVTVTMGGDPPTPGSV